jgi:ribosome-associated protein
VDEDRDIVVNDGLRIPLSEVELRYVRSSGPGGQNINKVATKAALRWPAATSPSLPGDVRRRFLARFGSRLTKAGELVLSCDAHRDRLRNRAECLDRLRDMIALVATPPTPRRKTRPSRAAKERRLLAKRMRSERKRQRNTID